MFDVWPQGSAVIIWIAVILASCLIGNLSPATLVSRAAGIDIRKTGSGNPGTTNVLRVLGKKAAALTLLIDVLKGVAAVWLGRWIGGEALAALCGLAVFVGHIWPVFYRFKGGKGIATGLGLLLALDWRIGLLCLLIAACGIAISRRVSVGSLLAGAALPLLTYKFQPDHLFILSAMAIIVFFRHRTNIVRLVKGEEPAVRFNKK
jgi:glycerol-3-phosphate acyltransferase PlsY